MSAHDEDPVTAKATELVADTISVLSNLRTYPDGWSEAQIVEMSEEAIGNLEAALKHLGWTQADIDADFEQRVQEELESGNSRQPYRG